MKNISLIILFSVLLIAAFPCANALAEVCGHDLKIELNPSANELTASDTILVEGHSEKQLIFHLAPIARIESVLLNGIAQEYSFRSGELQVPLHSPSPATCTISYRAVFNDPIPSDPVSFDNPGFGVVGTITEEGTFLLPDSGWYPRLPDSREIFDLKVTAPRGVYAVTAGGLIKHEDEGDRTISVWKIDDIGQSPALSAGRFVVHSKTDGKVTVYTYFLPKTDSLSETYLKASLSHIEFYEKLHGPYPFTKFAVVENFFPTGYGFPSYTLLGTSVLQLPFIPETSLKHEIAHSWWGNGVLVDDSGNWCEGLTTYVADYLSREIASPDEGKLYRRQALQDYATLAASGEDFPLRQFRGRTSPGTRAVGYGKAAFVFHMIRHKLGDEAFWRSLRQIYKDRLFTLTSWEDFRDAFIAVGGWNHTEARAFFDQWIDRSGAPVLSLDNVRSQNAACGRSITGVLAQKPPFFILDVVLGLTSSGTGSETTTALRDGATPFNLCCSDTPKQLAADPDANVFRLLHPEEIPATVNSVKGSNDLVAVLSDDTSPQEQDNLEILLAGLRAEAVPILHEGEIDLRKMGKRDFLFYGFPQSKKLQALFASVPQKAKLFPGGFTLVDSTDADCLFLVVSDPKRDGKVTALFQPVSGAGKDWTAAAARKVTHYGRLSYITFRQGKVADKGTWDALSSPLLFTFTK